MFILAIETEKNHAQFWEEFWNVYGLILDGLREKYELNQLKTVAVLAA